jgi:RNA polymerase Rpb2, domain 6
MVETPNMTGYIPHDPDFNELRSEFMGVQGFNFAAAHNSNSRAQMAAGHMTQHIVMENMEEKLVQTGLERDFAKSTFAIKMPANGQILRLIDRYPIVDVQGSLNHNPETLVIYENDETKEIDCFSIVGHLSHHQYFGFKYRPTPNMARLRQGEYIAKGTVFSETPGVSEDGTYMYGLNLNTAFMSIPGVSEDGIAVSRSGLKRMAFKVYENRRISCGSKNFPLNIHGTLKDFKSFPDIGDDLRMNGREDGLLMMLRSYDPDLTVCEMGPYDLMEPDYTFDTATYVRLSNYQNVSVATSRVVDIKVISNNGSNKQMPEAMCGQLDKYRESLLRYHAEIVATEKVLRRDSKKKYGTDQLNISPAFERLVVTSKAMLSHREEKSGPTLDLEYRTTPLDEYNLEFTIEFTLIPTVGFKLTDFHGGKGVIVKIMEDEDMPVDKDGNRAEAIMDSSVVNRMNTGRLYEHYINGAVLTVTQQLQRMALAAVGQMDKMGLVEMRHLFNKKLVNQIPEEHLKVIWDHMLTFYGCANEKQRRKFAAFTDLDMMREHLLDVLTKYARLYIPMHTEKHLPRIVRDIERIFHPLWDTVSYVGNSGIRCQTVEKVRIAPMHVLLLDKIADDWSSTSASKLHHFGILSTTTKSDKFTTPHKNTPVRSAGEAEGRIGVSYADPHMMAELLDRSNSPTGRRQMFYNLLTAAKPTNIQRVVDRVVAPLGNSRPIQIFKHMMQVAGIKLKYVMEKRKTEKRK